MSYAAGTSRIVKRPFSSVTAERLPIVTVTFANGASGIVLRTTPRTSDGGLVFPPAPPAPPPPAPAAPPPARKLHPPADTPLPAVPAPPTDDTPATLAPGSGKAPDR